MSDVTTTTTTTTEPKKGTLDDLVNLIKTIPPEDVQKLRDVLADGQITRDEIPILTGVGFRNWKTLAAIVVIVATVIGGWIGYVSSPKTDAEIAVLIKSGFEGQSKQLDNIVKAIEAKPVPSPIDPDKKPSKGAIPDEVSAKVGRLTLITSKEAVDQWIVPPGSPCEWDADGKRLTLVPIEAVEFSIGVVTQRGKSLAWCLVKAGVGPKPPPKPNPEPDPIVPTDEFTKAIHGAWQQEFAADKKDSATKMAACYRAASDKTASATSWGDLSATIKSKATEFGIAGKLPVVSKVINGQLLANGFPASPSVLLVAGDADKAKAIFVKVINALETLP
jgi:hypothetical protein